MSTFCLDVFKFIKSTQPINKSRVQKIVCHSALRQAQTLKAFEAQESLGGKRRLAVH